MNHLAKGERHFFSSDFVLGRDGHLDNGIREYHRFKRRRVSLITQCVTRLRVLHPNECNDVACLRAIEFFTLIGVHLNNTTDALAFAGVGI